MGKMLKEVRVFIASPGDVEEERWKAVEIINELNSDIAYSKGLTLIPITGADVASEIGERVQQVILERINMGEIDIFVGIMWQRFGTPTGEDYESGTEEEFHVAYDQWKVKGSPHIMFFFNEVLDRIPSKSGYEQLGKVITFKEKIGERGVIGKYQGVDSFKDVFRKDLTRIILNWRGKTEAAAEKARISPSKAEWRYFTTWRDAFADERSAGERVESFLYKSAKNSVKFMTISGRSVYSGDVEEALKGKGSSDFNFKLLLFDWNSPWFPHKMRDERRTSEVEIELAAEKACRVAENFLKMGRLYELNLEIRLYSEYPVWRYMIIDNEFVYLGYYPTDKRGYEGPMFIHRKGEAGSLFYPVDQHFNRLWEQSAPSLTLKDQRLKQ